MLDVAVAQKVLVCNTPEYFIVFIVKTLLDRMEAEG